MIEKKIKIRHKNGIHMRPCMLITDTAVQFKSDIKISKGDQVADARSIMQTTMLAAAQGEEITLRIDGEDEQKAFEAMEKLILHDLDIILEREEKKRR